MTSRFVRLCSAAVCGFVLGQAGFGAESPTSFEAIEAGFRRPPQSAGVRCFWWWLNGNVTKEAITRDLEEMKAKGFSGAQLTDAGGAEQRGNRQVPAGPVFASEAWLDLFSHAVKEAERLELELSVNILSGWNVGGPMITEEMSAKTLTWSEIRVEGPKTAKQKMPLPKHEGDYYRDIAVLALPFRTMNGQPKVRALSAQEGFPVEKAFDGDASSFWVSGGKTPGQGPTAAKPEVIEITFSKPITIDGLRLEGRKGYGPKQFQLLAQRDDKTWQTLLKADAQDGEAHEATFAPLTAGCWRIAIETAYDVGQGEASRNVQVAELALMNGGESVFPVSAGRRPIRDLEKKAVFDEIGWAAPDCRFLLEDVEAIEGEEDAKLSEVVNISDKMDAEGVLTWDVPEGVWTVLRFGYTLNGARVSTSSEGWNGRVIDYMDAEAFRTYWKAVVEPMLNRAGPAAGKTLKYLQSDSWECGGANWTKAFAQEFQKRRGYNAIPYLPVIAGKIIESRDASNAFLADFRKTVGDCVAENHYGTFAKLAAEHGMGIHPESGGPHAGPFDAIRTLGLSAFAMGEFWVPSPHRSKLVERFYVKQTSSTAHIYGQPYAAAEAFTSIGPHWDDVLWSAHKPTFDHEFCSGLSLCFMHTFTCSPKEMGVPGQEYFAGTHFNPQVTWWEQAGGFLDYLHRCQFMAQQGRFAADVLYYQGDHVPNLVQLKEADPAGAMPGYDYDVTDEEILLNATSVQDGRIVLKSGMSYRVLVLPDHRVLSLAALEKIKSLVENGATVVGTRPTKMVSLVSYPASQGRFEQLTDQVWGEVDSPSGEHTLGNGKVVWGKTARQALADEGAAADFEMRGHGQDARDTADRQKTFDYIHYTVENAGASIEVTGETPMPPADVYFVRNQTDKEQAGVCAFRVVGKRPQLWNLLNGDIQNAAAFTQGTTQTEVPLEFGPYGSWCVVFRQAIGPEVNGSGVRNTPELKNVMSIEGAWQVSFDPKWGGPASVQFDKLMSWTEHGDPGVKFYSGKAVYSKRFDLSTSVEFGKRYWLDLGMVKDTGIASVKLNGKEVGVLWTMPFRAEVTGLLKPAGNSLELTVVNSWRNRLVRDRDLPESQRLTKTNVTIPPEWKIVESGLLLPVTVFVEN